MPEIKVTLTPKQFETAARVGLARHVDSLKRNSRDTRGFSGDNDSRLLSNINGAVYELVYSLGTKTEFLGHVGTFQSEPDGYSPRSKTPVEVKGSVSGPSLIVPRNVPSGFVVAVTGAFPNYAIIGYIHSEQAKNPCWLTDKGNGREKSFFVPFQELKSISL